MFVAFCKHTLLPLDDCLYAVQATIPHLARSSLHRCLQRHGISRLLEVGANERAKQPFKACLIGYFHIDIAEVRTEQGKLHLVRSGGPDLEVCLRSVARRSQRQAAAALLEALIAAVPYKIHTTDNGVQFCDMPQHRSGPTARYRLHAFDRVCRQHDVEHRLTKPNHPWTNGQVEPHEPNPQGSYRDHDITHRQLRDYLTAFLDAYNFAKRLKTLRGLTPYEHICKAWADHPHRFRYDPTHLTSGLNT